MTPSESRVGQLLLAITLLGATQGEIQLTMGRQSCQSVFK